MVLADIDPQVIIVFVAMIFAGLKALFEKIAESKRRKRGSPHIIEDYVVDDQDYLEKLAQQRRELEIPNFEQPPPPPLPEIKAPSGQAEFFETAEPAIVTPPPVKAVPKPAMEIVSQKKPTFISTRKRLKQHLSSPTAAREALLLAEVLGRPKSLR